MTSSPPRGPHVRATLLHRTEYRLPSQKTKGDGTGVWGFWIRIKKRQPRTALRRYANSKQSSKHLSWLHWRRGIPNTMPFLSGINHRHVDASRCGLADWTGYVGTSRCEVFLHDAVSRWSRVNPSVLGLPGPHKSHLGSRISGNHSGLVPHLVPQPPKSSLPPTRQRAQLSRK